MKKILWVSRHDILPSQRAELNRLFGEVEVRKDPRPFSSAEEIKERFQKGGYDEIVVVAPLSVIARLTELEIRPLWAEMEQCDPSEAEVEAAGRWYRFRGFKRIKGIRIEFEEV